MVVENVFSSPSKVQVLRVLSSSSSALSPQELEKECTKNISVIYDAVRELEAEGVIVSVNPEGRKNYYRLNMENSFSDSVRTLFRDEKEEKSLSDVPAHLLNIVFDVRNRLKSGVEGLELVLIFGSVARGDFTPESDIDLYLVVEEKSLELEDKVYDLLEDYDRDFSVVIRDREAYRNDFSDEPSELGKSIMLEGFSIIYSSDNKLKEVLMDGLSLDYLADKGLAEEKKEIQKLMDVLANLDYEEDSE